MLKRLVAFTLVALLGAGSVPAATWNVDVSHSSIDFSVSHLVIAKVRGGFDQLSGVIEFDGENWDKASTTWTVDVATINTRDTDRDAHLRSADFFEVEKYPSMTFTSKKVIRGEGSNFKLVGDLTIKDVTREVTFDGEFRGVITDPWGNTRAGFSAEATIDRKDYNITWNKVLDTGGLTVGNKVDIKIEVEAIKQ
jgi:polyisoprenoid-binding protein YceI